MELKEGEKYLSIQLLGSVQVAAFKNKNKKTDKHPDYVGNGIAIWISEKKGKDTQQSEVPVEDVI